MKSEPLISFFHTHSLMVSERHEQHLGLPVFIDVLDLIDLLLNALTGHSVRLQLVNLLVNQVRDGFVEILQEVLDHLWDDVVGLLLVLSLVGEVCFRIACKVVDERKSVKYIHHSPYICGI